MRIWIDGYEANVESRVGSGQYGFEILKNLEEIDEKNEYTILLPTFPLGDLPKPREGWRYKVLKPAKLWTRIALPMALYLSKEKVDVSFSPTHYIPRFSPIPRVCTIFDLSYLHFPEMFKAKDIYQLKNWTKYSIENADHIITISNFTKKDIIDNYHIDPDKITVTYLGYDQENFYPLKDKKKVNEILNKYNIKQPYIIYIGTMQPRKNLVRLIEAFSSVVGEDDRLNLVIVGKTTGPGREGWMFQDILKAPKKFDIENRVIFTSFAPTKDLPALLSASEAFILPSLWEGFGIPALEAMACGTPVLVSNVSSLPEVVGHAAALFDPYSVKSISEAIAKAANNGSIRKKRVQLGLKQAKKFSWVKCAEETLKILENFKND